MVPAPRCGTWASMLGRLLARTPPSPPSRPSEAGKPGAAAAMLATPPFQLYPPRSRAGLDPNQPDQFVPRIMALRKAFMSQPRVARHGSLQLLELDQIRQRFGRRWPELRAKVWGILEAALARELGPDEAYVAASETLIYILRIGLIRGEVERHGQLMAAEVTERLCGAVPGGVAVRLRTMPFDFDHGLSGVASFGQLRNRIEAQGQALDDAELRLFLDHVEQLRPLFWPTIHLRKRLVSGYQLIPMIMEADGRITRLDELCGASLHGVFDAECDNWSVQQVGRILDARCSGRRHAPVLVSIHYETLAAMRLREPFLILCRQLPRISSRLLLFEIIDLPPGLPQARVRDLAAYLQPFCLTMVARLRPDAIVADHLHHSGIRAVSLRGRDLDPDRPESLQRLAMLADVGRAMTLRSLLIDVPSSRLAHLALRAGIAHLNGDGFMPPVAQPGRVFSLPRPFAPSRPKLTLELGIRQLPPN